MLNTRQCISISRPAVILTRMGSSIAPIDLAVICQLEHQGILILGSGSPESVRKTQPPASVYAERICEVIQEAVADLSVCVGVSKRDRRVFLKGKLKMIVGGL